MKPGHSTSLLLCVCLLNALVSSSHAQTATVVPRSTDFHFDGLHLAPDGYLYFGGSWKGSRVYRSTLEGEVEVFAEGDFQGPTDLVMDSQGNLFVTNYNSTFVSKIAPDGTVTRFAETPLGPAGIAIDSHDNLFVTIYGTPAGEGHSVLKITPQGETSTYAQDPALHASVGIAVDDADVVYVLGGRDAGIQRITGPGQLERMSTLPLAHGMGGGAHLDWAAGQLFASSGIGAVYRIESSGALHYVLREGQGSTERGPTTSPLLKNCNGLTAAPDGKTLFLGCFVGDRTSLVRLDGASPPPTTQAGWKALQAGDSASATAIFNELAQADPVPAGVSYGLGALRYREGEFTEAARLFGLAAAAPQSRAPASYDQACAHALSGNVDAALDALDRAVAAGYSNINHMSQDTDLMTLHDDPRWRQLLGDFRVSVSPKPDDGTTK